ncbi:hypothetical protein [Micromonospora echinofusca]|uniref:Peptidase MA superfamily n=1 Tax=Micromonospora echinofusca TaxID=47858 RepID=A0ABS3VY41_MICEH|nr:hypothetical protein [Micromonospora echinofusca]MBO4209457.1 hypothetical protein [Micromonospora echinofusca]
MTGVDQPSRPRRWWPVGLASAAAAALLGAVLPTTLLSGPDAGPPAPAASPRPGDPPAVLARWLGERIGAELHRQAGALLRGDEAAWLAVAEPPAQPDLRRRYAALRAMQVSVWQAEPVGVPEPVDGQPGQWQLRVVHRHCFVDPDCLPAPVQVQTRWRLVAGVPRLLAVDPVGGTTGSRPWEVSELAVTVGERTLVATTPALRGQLPALLRDAEEAARTADRYAVGTPPTRYVVYYAGAGEWRRWFGGGRAGWTAGYAVSTGGRHEVVLNSVGLRDGFVDDLLRHELTHVATLPVRDPSADETWWLVEGLAELAGAGGRPVARYQELPQVRRLVTGDWNGRLDGAAPPAGAGADRVAAGYGVGYLAVRHLALRYGEQALVAFVRAVLHDRRTLDEAARRAFGGHWAVLHEECVAAVRVAVAGD